MNKNSRLGTGKYRTGKGESKEGKSATGADYGWKTRGTLCGAGKDASQNPLCQVRVWPRPDGEEPFSPGYSGIPQKCH